MKTPLFFLAALAAFFLLPLDFTVTVSVLFGAGLAAILVADYKRTLPALRVPVAASTQRRSKQTLRLAA